MTEFEKEYLKPYVIDEMDYHWHEPDNIVKKSFEVHNNPVVAFYYAYYALDWECRTFKIQKYIEDLNKILKTDYKNLDDFLKDNNINSKKEWKEYVLNDLLAKREEEEIYGDYTSRR